MTSSNLQSPTAAAYKKLRRTNLALAAAGLAMYFLCLAYMPGPYTPIAAYLITVACLMVHMSVRDRLIKSDETPMSQASAGRA